MSTPVHIVLTTRISRETQLRIQEVSSRVRLYVYNAEEAKDIPKRLWEKAEVLYSGDIVPPPDTETALKWIQSPYAGVDNFLKQPFFQTHPSVILTSSSGIHASVIAEHVFGMMLALGRHLVPMLEHQSRKEWSPERYRLFLPHELRGATLGILGYGSIGREVARLGTAWGMTVLATKRHLKDTSDQGFTLGEDIGDKEGEWADRLYPPEATAFMVKECDFVVITLPLTENTRNLFSREMIGAMKPTAYLINVGRGGILDEVALGEALQEGRIAGAALDVFAEEPLPPQNPLWTAPNLIITPHIAGNMPAYFDKATLVFEENLRRYLKGQPLLNVVDLKQGY